MNTFRGLICLPGLLLALNLGACKGNSGSNDAGIDAVSDADDGGQYPDPAFIYEAVGQTETVVDETFQMETPRLYRTAEELPSPLVTHIQDFGTRVLAGSVAGIMVYDSAEDRFESLSLPDGDEPVVDIARRRSAGGLVPILTPTRLILFDFETVLHEQHPHDGSATCVGVLGDEIYLGTNSGLLRLEEGAWVPVVDAPATAVRDVLPIQGGRVWLATAEGLWELDNGAWQQHRADDGFLTDDDVLSLAPKGEAGGFAAGSALGVAVIDADDQRLYPAGVGGLPRGGAASLASDGSRILVGHDLGASLFVPGEAGPEQLNYYHSLRWIPDEQVNAVAMGQAGGFWIATSAGITRITTTPRTLAERAELFEAANEQFWRLDFVACSGMRSDPFDTDEPLTHRDHDNDGLWTQMQVGAWCYAAGATGQADYCEKARRAMGGMMRQIDIPAVSFEAAGYERGFVCRSFVRDDEGALFDDKIPRSNWHLVENWEDGHDYTWKDDTSSDETTGHFFGYPLFYDFCADEAEKAVLAEHIGALARHIVRNDFRLIDLDGERTLHGHWDPETLAIALDGIGPCAQDYPLEECLSAAYGGGWLNAIEILGHMLAAYHMTGDPFFYDAYTTLIDVHRYDELVDFHDEIYTVSSPAIANHSDHELAMLGYHTLIRYEPDDERRQRWIDSLLAMYEYEKPERNPCWSAFVAGFATGGYELEAAVGTLREWPEDWREWRVDNSHRLDVEKTVNDRHDREQIKTVLPYDEIRTMKWNGNPYALVGGGDGREVQAPWPWLLPYWMYRYHGIIE